MVEWKQSLVEYINNLLNENLFIEYINKSALAGNKLTWV